MGFTATSATGIAGSERFSGPFRIALRHFGISGRGTISSERATSGAHSPSPTFLPVENVHARKRSLRRRRNNLDIFAVVGASPRKQRTAETPHAAFGAS